MLLGASRQYKESGNCRLEAQYAMQREVPTIPLMLADGYRADGWLGMLIGTRMWYGFFGAVLSEESLFDGKVSELCRDLGDRGQSSGVAAHRPAAVVEARTSSTLWLDLAALKLSGLRLRAAEAGIAAAAIEEAEDGGDPRAALVGLLVNHASESEVESAERLDTLKLSQLRKRAAAAGAVVGEVDAAADGVNPREELIQLILSLA